MAHALAGRSGLSGDKRCHRLSDVLFDKFRRLLFRAAADLTHHQDRLRSRIILEELQGIDERGAYDWITPEADAGRLSESKIGELPNRLIGQGAAAADEADRSRLVDVAGHDADLALAR